MIELGALAVRCGLTNVLSEAIGAQPGSREPMSSHGGCPMGHNVMHFGSCYQFWEDHMDLLRTVGEALGAPGFEGHPLCHARTPSEALILGQAAKSPRGRRFPGRSRSPG